MKTFVRYALLLCLLLSAPVYADITIEGESVHVETDSYAVRFDKGVMVYIHNKLTDETYTKGAECQGWSGMLSYHSHSEKYDTIVTHRTPLSSAILVDPFNAEFLFQREDGEVRLYISIDRATDDLLINIEGVSDSFGVVGLQWGLDCLDMQNLSLIVPSDGGRIIDVNTKKQHIVHNYPSSNWEAQLAIAQGERGGFYVRNTDNTFQYKWSRYSKVEDVANLDFGTYNQAPFNTHSRGKSDLWRFNTYAGGWRVPARIYRDWMEKAFQPRRLSDMPRTEDITLFVRDAVTLTGNSTYSLSRLERLAELVDPTKTLLLFAGWAYGGEWWSGEHDEPYPDYFPVPELAFFVEAAHRYGFRVVLYLTAHGFSPNHPLYPHFQQYQYRDTWTGDLLGDCWDDPLGPPCDHPGSHRLAHISSASSEWRNLLVRKLKTVWEESGVDGFFLDGSHAVINDANGLIDGLNMAQGMSLLHKELAETMPGVVLMGERLHEASFAYASFALRPLLLGNKVRPHPISTFLFSPFVHASGFALKPPHLDIQNHLLQLEYQEIWGLIPGLNIGDLSHLNAEYIEVHKLLDLARAFQPQYGLNADVNGDGQVNILDLTLVAQSFGGTLNRPETDVNGDGQVNVLDLILVANRF